jgi:hypothetical protein
MTFTDELNSIEHRVDQNVEAIQKSIDDLMTIAGGPDEDFMAVYVERANLHRSFLDLAKLLSFVYDPLKV